MSQTLVPDHYVLESVIQGMADMERAGDIGWRIDNGERGGVRSFGAEQAVAFPVGIPFRLDGGGVESLVEFGAHAGSAFASQTLAAQPLPRLCLAGDTI